MQKYKTNLGKANAIFKQITSDNYSEDEKLRSILTVLDMETHNGITKDMILKAFRQLFDYAIDVGPEVRLTEKTETGFWKLKGVSWEQLQESHVITKDMSQKIYGALAKLKDYEETGLDPGQVEEAVQRLTPQKPKKVKWEFFSGYRDECPRCGNFTIDSENDFCPDCGQPLKWEE